MSVVVGQKLWYVPHPHMGEVRPGQEVTVGKVGRKWANLAENDRLRFDLSTLDWHLDDQWPGGSLYFDRGFDADLPNPSTVATALLDCLAQAKAELSTQAGRVSGRTNPSAASEPLRDARGE